MKRIMIAILFAMAFSAHAFVFCDEDVKWIGVSSNLEGVQKFLTALESEEIQDKSVLDDVRLLFARQFKKGLAYKGDVFTAVAVALAEDLDGDDEIEYVAVAYFDDDKGNFHCWVYGEK